MGHPVAGGWLAKYLVTQPNIKIYRRDQTLTLLKPVPGVFPMKCHIISDFIMILLAIVSAFCSLIFDKLQSVYIHQNHE